MRKTPQLFPAPSRIPKILQDRLQIAFHHPPQVRLLVPMRFRIWHLLALMVLVGVWVRLSQWLVVLEAQDHPWPQETIDVIAFYLASATIVFLPVLIAWIVVTKRRKRSPA